MVLGARPFRQFRPARQPFQTYIMADNKTFIKQKRKKICA